MAKPDFDKLNPVMREASELFSAGKLTLAKLTELEKQAFEAAGDEYGEWREAMAQYRDVLEAFEGRED